MIVVKSFDNVWGPLTDTPAQASSMTARSDLRLAIQRAVAGGGLSQEAAAMRLGITRARASDLLNARIAKFSLDALTNLAANAASNVRQRLTSFLGRLTQNLAATSSRAGAHPTAGRGRASACAALRLARWRRT